MFSKAIFGEDSVFYSYAGKIVNLFENFEDKLPKIYASVSYILIVFVLERVIRFILKNTFGRIKRLRSAFNLLDSFLKYLAGILVIGLVLSAWGVDTSTLLAGVGIIGLVIGLGAQSLIEDIISGLFIVFERTFDVGDIIVIDDFRGKVTEIGVRTTRLVDIGGNIKVINNSDIRTIVNMTHELSLAICDVGIDYSESIERVEATIAKYLPMIRQRIPAIKEGPYYKGVNELGESGVVIRLIAKCHEEDKFQVVRDMNREIKMIFDRNQISIPFAQVVVNKPKESFKPASDMDKETAARFVKSQHAISNDVEQDNEN